MADNCVFERGDRCSALTKKDCANCAFRKTAEEHEASAKSARKRIFGLDDERREHIVKTYYPPHGKKRMDPRFVNEGGAI